METLSGHMTGDTVADQTGQLEDIENTMNGEKREINTRNVSESWVGKNNVPVAGAVLNRPQRKPNRRKPWIESLVAFANDVSVVGLRYVTNPSLSMYRRSVWILLIVTGAVFTTYQIQNRIRRYASYPKNVIIHVEHMEEMRFPTVTICNENRMSLSKIAALGKWRSCDFCKYNTYRPTSLFVSQSVDSSTPSCTVTNLWKLGLFINLRVGTTIGPLRNQREG